MMSQFGPLEIDCDAPTYSVVHACVALGFEDPLDVRWCRLSHFLSGDAERAGLFSLQAWKQFFGMGRQREKTCSCGQHLPAVERCTFTFLSGKKSDYLIGQCRRCRTIFWDEG
ncbi:MAG: hypothetical protein L0Z62_23420 [Gemmataceae bacterium]|nr:hypothetical protein [Gemmataceae bacterium]